MKLLLWIDARWPLSAMLRVGLEEKIPGGAKYAYVFGSAALIVFLLQIITGIWQVFYYVPTLKEAYNSLSYLRIEVPFGWLVHGLHYWGAQAMIILVLLHMSQVYLWGAYKRPHELQWLIGVGLLVSTMAMVLTGGVLSWDKQSYWVVEVASNIAGTVPLIGDYIKPLMLGGPAVGQLTIARFFTLHTTILSGFILVLTVAHLIALRAAGSAGTFNPQEATRTGPFWPDQVFRDGLFSSLVFFTLIVLSAWPGAPVQGMADPLDSSYAPKPEWNFLFLYQVLKYFPGHLEPLATVGIPFLGTLLLVLIPFIDRNPERRPSRRPLAITGYIVIMGAFIAFTILGHYSTPGRTAAGSEAAVKSSPAASTVSFSNAAELKKGRQLFHSHGCIACHKVEDTGGTIGPDLSDEGNRGRSPQWIAEQIRNPKSHDPKSTMPAFSFLSRSDLQALVDFLLSLKSGTPPAAPAPAAPQRGDRESVSEGATPAASPGHQKAGEAAYILGNAGHGALLFNKNCIQCHGNKGTDEVPNPGSAAGKVPPLNPIDRRLYDPDPQSFADHIDLILQHGATPKGTHPALVMPPFGAERDLTQPEIADIEAYVLGLNHVDRARIMHPGIKPKLFIALAAGLNIIAWLFPAWVWIRGKHGKARL
ncbi:MAG: cytochrome b N-terminal domain-containing protein [Syntrophales bacterium]